MNFIIPLVIYPFDVMVSIAEPDDQLLATLKNNGIDTDGIELKHSSTQKGRTLLFAGNQTLIRLYDKKQTPEWHGVLAHEIFHAVEFIMERIGMSLVHESDEAYAYTIGYLTEQIYFKIKMSKLK